MTDSEEGRSLVLEVIETGLVSSLMIFTDWAKDNGHEDLAEFLRLWMWLNNWPAVPARLSNKAQSQADNTVAVHKMAQDSGDKWIRFVPELETLLRKYGWMTEKEREEKKKQEEERLRKMKEESQAHERRRSQVRP